MENRSHPKQEPNKPPHPSHKLGGRDLKGGPRPVSLCQGAPFQGPFVSTPVNKGSGPIVVTCDQKMCQTETK